MTTKEKPYIIEKKDSPTHGKSVNITTMPLFIDNAALVAPKPKRDHTGKETDKLHYSVRALMTAAQTVEFRNDVAQACSWMLNNVTQFHPLLLPESCDPDYITADFMKVGANEIAQRKAYDQKMSKVVPAPKKKYNTYLDYLEPLVYFYTSSNKPVPMFDIYKQRITPANGDFFRPSFKGRLKLCVKWIPQPGSNTPELGGRLVAYLNSVLFINALSENLMFEEPKFNDVPEGEEDALLAKSKTQTESPLNTPNTVVTAAAKPTARVRDEIDEYNESF